MRDNVKTRRLGPDGKWTRVIIPEGEEAINAQEWFLANKGIWHEEQ